MEFNKNEAAILAGSTTVEAPPASVEGEIDLYDELTVFAGLSPEEQLRLVAHSKESVQAAFEPVDVASPSAENRDSAIEIEATEVPPENISSTDDSVDSLAYVEMNHVSSEASEGQPVTGSLALHALATTPSPSQSDDIPIRKTKQPTGPLFDRSRTGPLLAGLNVGGDFIFAGDLSRGVCLGCGADSGADDLFCVNCGVFIDEIDNKPKFNPTCGECGQGIVLDEIFCPWCGAAPPA